MLRQEKNNITFIFYIVFRLVVVMLDVLFMFALRILK